VSPRLDCQIGLLILGAERDVRVDRLAVPPYPFALTRRYHDLESHLERLWLVGERRPQILEHARIRFDVIFGRNKSDVNRMGEALHLERPRHFFCHVVDVSLHLVGLGGVTWHDARGDEKQQSGQWLLGALSRASHPRRRAQFREGSNEQQALRLKG